jgi:copper chaperone NosL
MKKRSSLIIAFVSLAMISSLYLPLWDISLDAPQYPEGLMMQIWLDNLSGDVSTISGLNHYIGMKPISVDMFPEFSYMKYIVIGIVISGLIVAILRKKWLFTAWYIGFLIIAALGVYDFWLWEYDYGHNLDPRAAIIVPGMSYQPPLIGCKELLNFYACSFPATGGWIIAGAGTIAFLVFLDEIILKKRKSGSGVNLVVNGA